MNKQILLTLTIIISSYSGLANADDEWYLGALYNEQKISIHGRDFNSTGLIAGYQFNNSISFETRYLAGTSGYSSFYGTPEAPWGKYSENIDSQTSLLLKATYPILNNIKLYGLAGYTKTTIETKGFGQTNDSNGNIIGNYPYTANQSESGFSYGLGIDFEINEHFTLFFDYQALPDFEPNSNFSESWKSTTLGINYSF